MTRADATPLPRPPSWGEPRRKTITWYDPILGAQAGASLAGIDHLGAIRRGELPPPPMAAHFNFTIVEVSAGQVTFVCEPDESAYNPIGLVHGGLVCTLIDSVLGCAVQSTLPAGVGYTSIEIKVNYLRPVRADTGPLRAQGRVTKPGRRVAFAEADVSDPAGTLLATGQGTCLVMSE
ncbi:MAG: PaaI family thioesterase [Actinomycetota bacterium]|nr:PaaI family thioesterase [Actinomycetota bacterium]